MFLNNTHKGPSRKVVAYEPFRPADAFDERLAAFQLVYRSYLKRGLGARNIFKMRVTPFQLLETSQIFVATERQRSPISKPFPRIFIHPSEGRSEQASILQDIVISTVTLIGDGRLGLPMESMFGVEIEELRSQGRQLAEVACLADAVSDPRRFLQTFTQLTRLMAQFSRYQGVQNLVISVHPRHAKFYARYFGFRPITDRVANCPYVKNRLAVGLNLDFELFDFEKPKSWHEIFGSWVPQDKLRPCPIPTGEARFLWEVAQLISPQSCPPMSLTDQCAPRGLLSAA
jgi:hypothetical protein